MVNITEMNLYIVFLVYILIFFSKMYQFLIIFSVVMLILDLILFNQYKLNYNRSIESNGKTSPQTRVIVNKKGIQCIDQHIDNKTTFSFDQTLQIVKIKNLIILKLNYNLGLIINKNNLKGDSKEELFNYLFSNCKNINKKKVYKTRQNWYIIVIILND